MTKRFRIVWSDPALKDLEVILTYVAREESFRVASMLSRRLIDRVDSLASLPHRGRPVPELQNLGFAEIREVFHGPYRIYYRTEGAKVFLLGILDGRRDLEELLIERATRIDL